MKAKRKAMMAARLRKVRQHKLGQTADASMEDGEEGGGEGQGEGLGEDQKEEYVDKREGDVPPEAGKRHIRPWDRGKGESVHLLPPMCPHPSCAPVTPHVPPPLQMCTPPPCAPSPCSGGPPAAKGRGEGT